MQNHYKDSLYTFNRFFIMQIVIMVNYLSKQMFSLLHVLELQLLLQQIHYGLWRLGYKYCIVKLFLCLFLYVVFISKGKACHFFRYYVLHLIIDIQLSLTENR